MELIDHALQFDPGNAQNRALRESYLQRRAAAQDAAAAQNPITGLPAEVQAPTQVGQDEADRSSSSVATQPGAATASTNDGAGPASTAQATPTSVAGGSSCTAALAGYGTRSRGVCFDALQAGRGPDLVVIPAGGTQSKPFAIGRYEISVGEYGTYCAASGRCAAPTAQADLPMTTVAASDAQRYVEWLSTQTGATYRLPKESEWLYAANAPGGSAERDFNCVVEIGGQKIRGFGLVSARSGRANGWGLYNYIGNAQEWVETDSGWAARGGAYSDAISRCDTTLHRAGSGAADASTGFRVLRELQ
jgi:formylglycine-generating enzyme required for sulfatase activity